MKKITNNRNLGKKNFNFGLTFVLPVLKSMRHFLCVFAESSKREFARTVFYLYREAMYSLNALFPNASNKRGTASFG
jgi:hypothetical protein